MAKLNINYLIYFIFTFLIEIIIALFIHDNFIRPYIGDTLVILLVYFFIRIFCDVKFLPIYIFLFAALVEFGQKLKILEIFNLENNKLMSIVFGKYFDFKDILCYFAGTVLILGFRKYKLC